MSPYLKGILGGVVLGLFLLGGVQTGEAWRGNPNIQGPYCTKARQQAVHQAIENGNYAEWRSLMEQRPGQKRVLDVVNEDNFPQFVQAYQLAKKGDFDGADKIRLQLGLPPVYRGN